MSICGRSTTVEDVYDAAIPHVLGRAQLCTQLSAPLSSLIRAARTGSRAKIVWMQQRGHAPKRTFEEHRGACHQKKEERWRCRRRGGSRAETRAGRLSRVFCERLHAALRHMGTYMDT